jgi:hypothetical protein
MATNNSAIVTSEGGIVIPYFRGPLGLKNIQVFRMKWEVYSKQIEEHNNGLVVAKRIKARTLKGCMDPDILVVIAELYAEKAVEELEDRDIEEVFDRVCGK